MTVCENFVSPRPAVSSSQPAAASIAVGLVIAAILVWLSWGMSLPADQGDWHGNSGTSSLTSAPVR